MTYLLMNYIEADELTLKGVFGWVSMRDETGSSLMLGMSSSHLVFDLRDELIHSRVWLEE
jgi:hypothetical protein